MKRMRSVARPPTASALARSAVPSTSAKVAPFASGSLVVLVVAVPKKFPSANLLVGWAGEAREADLGGLNGRSLGQLVKLRGACLDRCPVHLGEAAVTSGTGDRRQLLARAVPLLERLDRTATSISVGVFNR